MDRTEVIALRGMETGSYTTMVARLGKSEAKSPVMSFAQSGETPTLAELCANGRSFALTSAETHYAPHRSDPRADLASGGTLAPAPAALGQEQSFWQG